MSPKPGTYSLTSPNAVHANRALNHAYWALGATIFVMVLHSLTPADGLLDIVWGAWMLFEFSQVIRYGIKSLRAGRRDLGRQGQETYLVRPQPACRPRSDQGRARRRVHPLPDRYSRPAPGSPQDPRGEAPGLHTRRGREGRGPPP